MLTTMVSPSQDIPVLCTSMWMRMGTRVLRRGSFRGVVIRLSIHVGPNGMNSKPSPTKSEFGSYTVLITPHDLRQLQTFICAIAHNPATRACHQQHWDRNRQGQQPYSRPSTWASASTA